jgi:hypothetical protein
MLSVHILLVFLHFISANAGIFTNLKSPNLFYLLEELPRRLSNDTSNQVSIWEVTTSKLGRHSANLTEIVMNFSQEV